MILGRGPGLLHQLDEPINRRECLKSAGPVASAHNSKANKNYNSTEGWDEEQELLMYIKVVI